MSAQRKRRQSKTHKHPHRDPGPRSSAMFHSRCVRVGEAFHALIRLPATQAAAVQPGQPAHITSNALPGLTLPGHVLTITPPGTDTAPSGTGVGTGPGPGHHGAKGYLITVVITHIDPRLRHGLPVDVSITTRTLTDVLMVPNTAVIRRGENFYVEVLEPDGRRHLVQFTPGLIGHDTTEILDGLTEGQEVILTAAAPETGKTDR